MDFPKSKNREERISTVGKESQRGQSRLGGVQECHGATGEGRNDGMDELVNGREGKEKMEKS